MTERPTCACGRPCEKQGGARTDYRTQCSRCRKAGTRKHGTQEDYHRQRNAEYALQQEQWREHGRECAKCAVVKPWPQEFYDRDAVCKTCARQRVLSRFAQRMLDDVEQWHHRLRMAASHLKNAYHLSYYEYVELLEHQDNRCAICYRRRKAEERFHVDHDHSTGAVRGLLCANHNTGLGRFGDDPALLRAAADYLESGGTAPVLGITAAVTQPAMLSTPV